MSIEYPLSKSSTVTGCCQSLSVIINGWLFPKYPLGWSMISCCHSHAGSRRYFPG